jgi:hypothetical protein
MGSGASKTQHSHILTPSEVVVDNHFQNNNPPAVIVYINNPPPIVPTLSKQASQFIIQHQEAQFSHDDPTKPAPILLDKNFQPVKIYQANT